MPSPRPKPLSGKLIESSLNLLEGAAAFGLISGAALAAAVGKFMLGGLLAVFALGVFARLSRRTKAQAKPGKQAATGQ